MVPGTFIEGDIFDSGFPLTVIIIPNRFYLIHLNTKVFLLSIKIEQSKTDGHHETACWICVNGVRTWNFVDDLLFRGIDIVFLDAGQ